MKKFITWILCIAAVLSIAGCGSSAPAARSPGAFYYRRQEVSYGSSDSVIAPEIRELAGMEKDLDALLDTYFAGPESDELLSPFPRDSRAVSWELADNTLTLTMNDAFAELSGVELTIACSCIARTFLELTDGDTVRIQAENGLLGTERSITLTKEAICLYDDSLDLFRADFTVYYTDPQRRYLIAQEVSVNLATESDIVAHLMDQLLHAPEDSGLISALPADTRVLDYSIDNGLCTINFSAEFEYNSPYRIEAQRLCLLSVVNTLTQLDHINQVEFCAEGNLLVQYGRINLTGPMSRDENAIGPVRTGMGEFDASLYLANGTEQYLATVPTRLRQSAGISQQELVISALIEYSALNGFYSTIPVQTQVNSVVLRNGICYVDLSEEFLSDDSRLVTSVHSIIASVCALEDVYSAQITINGQVPQGEHSDLFVVMSPQSDWFL